MLYENLNEENKIYKWLNIPLNEIRSEVLEFAQVMEYILRDNDHKNGWNNLSYYDLFIKISKEFNEMYRNFILYTSSYDNTSKRKELMVRESIDISNFCMMLYINEKRKYEYLTK